MQYKTVFDIADAGYKAWTFPAFGLIFVAIGVALVGYRLRMARDPRGDSTRGRVFPFLYLGFALVWTIVSFVSTYREYLSLERAAKSDVRVVQGVVSSFSPMPYTGHAMERFCVSEVCFAYSDFVVTSGFNNTTSHGGPIREGLPVRVTYAGGSIVKLEVAQ